MEKYLSKTLLNDLSKKADDNQEINGTIIARPPIYVLCCIKDSILSNMKKYLQADYCIHCHSGTIRNFVECNHMSFLSRCRKIQLLFDLAHLTSFLQQCRMETQLITITIKTKIFSQVLHLISSKKRLFFCRKTKQTRLFLFE